MKFTWKELCALSLAALLALGCSKDDTTDETGDPGTGPDTPPAEEVVEGEVNSDLWAATDPLGRKLPEADATGGRKSDKTVAIFYWTWHCDQMVEYGSVGNISRILKQYPEAIDDKNHPAWNRGGGNTHFWGEPLFGYYRTTDPWVLRKHAEMLADAGVDAVFFDCTNGTWTWKSSYTALLKTWDQARKDGVKVPKISFILPFGPNDNSLVSLRQLYRDIYRANRYKDLWFMWKGKPCLMAYPDNLTDKGDDPLIREFFTFRPGQPDSVNGPANDRQWGWLEVFPQHLYGRGGEMTTVGVAQNTSPDRKGHAGAFNVPGSYGRSFTKQNGFDSRPDAYLYGANFQEQWNRALELDPELVFVTGWNEYIAGKWDRGTAAGDTWNGYPFSFVDQFDWDHSRDIEPNNEWFDSEGNYMGDTYYYQLIENVRRFKGMSRRSTASAAKTIEIGSFSGWADVAPDFAHYRGNTLSRNHRGHADKNYVNNTGRNDIVDARVARDDEYMYFFVKTAEPMTPPSKAAEPNWMWLLIDADRNRSTGWEGYDFIVNYEKPGERSGTIYRNTGGKWTTWEKAGTFDYALKDNQMELRIPRAVLGMDKKIDFEFKWADNMPLKEFNLSYFYSYGDAAPGGRFNFVYTVK